MLYEMRTYALKPGSVPAYLERFAEALSVREKYSPLGGFWSTEIGPLNHVVHVWPYEDMKHREEARAGALKDPSGKWPPPGDLILKMDSELLMPAPFMRPWTGHQELGSIYELRIYTFQVGTMPQVLERWAECVPHREKYSPLAGCWTSDVGGLNRFFHLWPYRDLAHRAQVRTESFADPNWPPPTREFLVSQENMLLVPASFSPMR